MSIHNVEPNRIISIISVTYSLFIVILIFLEPLSIHIQSLKFGRLVSFKALSRYFRLRSANLRSFIISLAIF